MKYGLLFFIFSIFITILINFLSSYFKLLIYKPNSSHKEKFNNTIHNTGIEFFLHISKMNLSRSLHPLIVNDNLPSLSFSSTSTPDR
mgnify:CR=1 FL=1